MKVWEVDAIAEEFEGEISIVDAVLAVPRQIIGQKIQSPFA